MPLGVHWVAAAFELFTREQNTRALGVLLNNDRHLAHVTVRLVVMLQSEHTKSVIRMIHVSGSPLRKPPNGIPYNQ